MLGELDRLQGFHFRKQKELIQNEKPFKLLNSQELKWLVST
ncbi:hypothetical protein DOT_0801 [Desulfosporosinus sp. OT]|nr:hypothetical protein DOT_0801 [Desulfosporosinus sp. OT]